MKKGLSAIISAVLLISFVIALGLIVITWSSGLVKKSMERSETRVGSELECGGVELKLEPSGTDIIIKNNGDKDIKGYIIREIKDGEVEVKNKNIEIESYGARKHPDSIANLDKVEIIPQINIDGEIIDCPGKTVIYCIDLTKC